MLDQAGYSHVYASGPHKLHGCLIAFKTNLYTLESHKTIYYDDQDIPHAGSESPCRGSSFRTKNIASLVALRLNRNTAQGIVVATTHLFWHPRYTYERIRCEQTLHFLCTPQLHFFLQAARDSDTGRQIS
jgi:RNA exonuclease NGL2